MTWFDKLTGFNETTPDEIRSKLILNDGVITSTVNGKSYRAGTLQVVSLADLRTQTNDWLMQPEQLTVTEIVGDVQALHQDPANVHALFQAASQFNLLEMTSHAVTPERGIGIYQFDHTQGPACAIACGAGTLYRNYFAEVNGQLGQTANNQIDCLDTIAEYLDNEALGLWHMKNGYMLPSEAGLLKVNQILGKASDVERDKIKSMLKIGLQWNTEVTINGNGQLVSQAYCSAVPVAYTHIDPIYWEGFACLILEALYEATLHAGLINARENGSTKVFLTLVGGGAFGNELSWIVDALATALQKFKNTNIDVVIVSYGRSNSRIQSLVQQLKSN